MILYTQCTNCEEIKPTDGKCEGADDAKDGATCEVEGDNCVLKTKSGEDKDTSNEGKQNTNTKSTNSSEILNIFKLSFTLLIIFTIL